MTQVHDIMAVHGVGEQRRGDTLTRFTEQFYKGVRQMVQEAGRDPNQVELSGRYQENRMEVRYRDLVFRLWEISWERSFQVPGAGMVLDWLGLWSSQYLNRALWQMRDEKAEQHGRRPWPRMLWLLALLLDLTLIVPLLAAFFWVWAAGAQVRHQKENGEQIDEKIINRHRLATGLTLTLATPLIVGLHTLARLGRLAAPVPFVGRLAERLSQGLQDLVIGSLGDILLYIFDPVQSAFIRGDLERAIEQACTLAQKEDREPQIHVIGHSMGSVIAYEVASRSLKPELRRHVKTLCTMGTVLDMIRYVLGGEGLVLAEQVRFGDDIPREAQGQDYPRWLNLFARNDPATGFGPLLEFGDDPTNRPVRSTPKGHSTYWLDRQGVYQTFLSWVARDDPLFDKQIAPPPPEAQTGIGKDIRAILLKLALLVGTILGAALIGAWQLDVSLADLAEKLNNLLGDAALPWPLSWLALALVWLLANLTNLLLSLPGWYLKWLLWLGVALLVWIVLALPVLVRLLWNELERRRLVPTPADANLDHWVGALERVGPVYEVMLRKKGIWTVRDFLVMAARPGGLAKLAQALDVSEDWVLRRARQANLMRLPGLGPREANLLMASGVDSMETLSHKDRGSLLEQTVPSFSTSGMERPPSGGQLNQWIEQAKELKDVV